MSIPRNDISFWMREASSTTPFRFRGGADPSAEFSSTPVPRFRFATGREAFSPADWALAKSRSTYAAVMSAAVGTLIAVLYWGSQYLGVHMSNILTFQSDL